MVDDLDLTFRKYSLIHVNMSSIAQQLSQKFSYECTIGKYVENVNVVIFCLVQVENLEELKLPSILWQMFHYITQPVITALYQKDIKIVFKILIFHSAALN